MIIQSPENQTVCEGGTATFTCIVMFPNGSDLEIANWGTDGGRNALTDNRHTATNDINGRSAPADVINVLTLTNVGISDNGADYACIQGLIDPILSNTSFLTVVGKYTNYCYLFEPDVPGAHLVT